MFQVFDEICFHLRKPCLVQELLYKYIEGDGADEYDAYRYQQPCINSAMCCGKDQCQLIRLHEFYIGEQQPAVRRYKQVRTVCYIVCVGNAFVPWSYETKTKAVGDILLLQCCAQHTIHQFHIV